MIVDAPDASAPSAVLWIPPIRRTVATEGTGLPGLIESIQAHAEHLRQSGEWVTRERARLEAEFDLSIQEALVGRFRASVTESKMDEMLESIQNRKISPREAVNVLLKGSDV
jgi:LAO/AO transport system kinase